MFGGGHFELMVLPDDPVLLRGNGAGRDYPFPAGDRGNRERQFARAADTTGLHGRGGGPAEEEALAEVHFALLQGEQIAAALYPLRHDLCPNPTAEGYERLNEGLLGLAALVADVADDLAIDLDDGRLQGRDDVEAGVAGAGVVYGEAEAEAAKGADLLLEAREVGDGLLLGAFDHELAWRKAGSPHALREGTRFEARGQDRKSTRLHSSH